jgi:hypothetical protein
MRMISKCDKKTIRTRFSISVLVMMNNTCIIFLVKNLYYELKSVD